MAARVKKRVEPTALSAAPPSFGGMTEGDLRRVATALVQLEAWTRARGGARLADSIERAAELAEADLLGS